MGVSPRLFNAARSIAQVGQITYATYDVTTTYGVTIGQKSITQIGTGGTITTTVAALLALLQASTEPEFTEVAWTANAGVLTYTVPATGAGKPVTVTGTVSGGTGTQTPAAVTANSGPAVYDIAGNWSTITVPAAGDNVYLDNSSGPLLYDLSQAGTTLTTLNIGQPFVGTVGLPKTNRDGQPYTEYRTDYLTVDVTTVNIGLGTGQGSGRIKLNQGTVATTWNVANTGSPLEQGIEACLLKGTNAGNVLNVRGGSVGIAIFGGELATVNVALIEGQSRVRFGLGVTLNTITVLGGTVEINSAVVTKLTVRGGTVIINGSGAVADFEQSGGLVVYNSTGALGGATPLLGGSGTLDYTQDPRTGKVITNPLQMYGKNCRFLNRNRVITAGYAIKFQQGATQAQVDVGDNATGTYS